MGKYQGKRFIGYPSKPSMQLLTLAIQVSTWKAVNVAFQKALI